MKVKITDENNLIVFLNKLETKGINFTSKDNLEVELKDMFKKLNSVYNIKIYGYYNVSIYIDEYYGVVIDLSKEDIDYLDDDNNVDMCIVIVEQSFLYEIDDLFNIKTGDVYRYKNKYYLKLNNDISNIEMGNLLEHSNLIYGDKVKNILDYGNVLKKESYVL